MEDEYRRRTPASAAMRERFVRCLPGGETRSVAFFEPYPVVIASGEGAVIHDIDGNEYVDVLNNYTSLVHGHAHPLVTEALVRAARQGTVHPAPHVSQAALAEHLVERFPAVERVRFTNSGSEAAVLAARLARHVTGRSRLVLATGAYHGTGSFFADAHPDVVRVPYNDPAALAAALDETVAAVFLEPFLGSAGVIPADSGYLQAAQAAAEEAGALFVLDEIQGLRADFNGVHGRLGLQPDLVLMGKIIGGGLPVGAVGGRGDLLDALAAAGGGPRLAHSGTFNGNVVTMEAGLVSMTLLDPPTIATLNKRAQQIGDSISAAATRHGLPVHVLRFGSIMHVHFLADAPRDATAAAAGDHRLAEALHLALLVHGVFPAPRGMLNLSTALTDAQVDQVRGAYDQALSAVAELAAEGVTS